MQGEIICIGDELISGRVADRNARYAARRFQPLGIEVRRVTLVGDEPGEIQSALGRALAKSDFVLVSGGLGSTDDDRTAQAAADVFDLPLEESRCMVKNLREFLEARGRCLTSDLRKMAQLPLGAEVLSATCAGFRLTSREGKPVFFLPGVPGEMKNLTDDPVLPYLLKMAGGGRAFATRELRVFGLAEIEVQEKVRDLGADDLCLGYYVDFPEVKLLLTATSDSLEKAEARAGQGLALARERLAEFVSAYGGQTLEERVVEGLAELGLSLSLAESCTGGLVGHRITQVAGASKVLDRSLVVYSNQAKEQLLGVRHETLAAFGAVSNETAAEMALGAARSGKTDLGLSITGIAGPEGGSPEKPVGTVCFGLARGEDVRTGRYLFHGSRSRVKAQAATNALDWLRRYLEDHAFVHST